MDQVDLFKDIGEDDVIDGPAAPDVTDSVGQPTAREYFDADVSGKSSYAYFMRVDPDMRDFLGPIETVEDEVTGRAIKKRWAKIAMVRGAKDENLKSVDVYLEPFPHIRIPKAKDLQGWYSSKDDGALHGQRDRPCETDAILTQPYGGWCNVGCQFSLCKGEMIETLDGERPIESLVEGDVVLGRSVHGVVPAVVLGRTKHWKPEGYVVVALDDGRELMMTQDHPVYSADRGCWVAASDLRSGEELEDLQRLSEQDRRQEDCLPGLFIEDQVGERQEENRPTVIDEGQAEVTRNQTKDEHRGVGASRVHVYSGSWTEDAGVAIGASRTSQSWGHRVPVIQAPSVHVSARSDVSNEVCLGSPDGEVAGRQGIRLGVRDDSDLVAIGVSVHPRLPVSGRPHIGGEGVPSGHGQGRSSQNDGIQSHRVGFEETAASRRPRVQEVRVMGEVGVWVYDIETTTGNFYQRGILVHNCYINSGSRGYRGSGLITVPMNYGEHVRRQLSQMKASTAGYFSSFTDPFLPLEEYYHNTQAGAQEFVNAGLPIFFLSRLVYPGWAIDLLRKNPYSYAQKSINTPDPVAWKKLSPGAISLPDNFDQIRELRKAGVYVSIQCNPIIPGVVTHDDVEELFEKLAEAGAHHVIVKFVEANHPWAQALLDRIGKKFPDKIDALRELFTENSCGGQKTIAEWYRRQGHERYQKKATALGMTYSLCYEYTKLKSGRWVSMGPEFLTADQCHGHRVPMHKRVSVDPLMFEPIEECPPHGCLRCGDSQDSGVGPCGSELLSSARALRMSDLKGDVFGKSKTIPLRVI